MTLAVDLSNYTTGFDAAALRDAGVRRAIVQVVNPGILTHREQIPALLEAGIEVEAYVYQWFSGGPEFIRQRMNWALDELAAYPDVRRVWLDCEQGEDDTPPYGGGMETTEMIREAVTLTGERAYEVGIYSAKGFWDRYLHGVTAFAMLPLWAAQYDGIQSTAIIPFGGWQRAEMKQYTGLNSLAGVSGIDINWYEEDGMEPVKVVNAEAIAAIKAAVVAVGQQDGDYLAVAGAGRVSFDVPAGKRAIIAVVKED